MRILQVCSYDWYAPGGVQTHVRELAGMLRTRGHDVLVAAPGSQDGNDADVHIVGRPWRIPFNGTIAPIAPQLSTAWRVRTLLRTVKPDLVHLHEPFVPSAAMFAGFLASAPIVATFHAHCDLRFGPWLYALGTWPLNRRVGVGIGVSPAATRCMSPRVRVPFHVVPNGVGREFFDLDASRRLPQRQRVLFAHRLEPRKGFGVALQAFARVLEALPDAELVVVGDGSERALVADLPHDVRARVEMRGTLSRASLVEAFADATVFVAPAVNGESFGVALIEAMAAGLPVVASDVPGYREVVGGAGVLVPPGNAAALADVLAQVLASPARCLELATAGRRRAERFAWDRIVTEIEGIYDEAIAAATAERQRVAI